MNAQDRGGRTNGNSRSSANSTSNSSRRESRAILGRPTMGAQMVGPHSTKDVGIAVARQNSDDNGNDAFPRTASFEMSKCGRRRGLRASPCAEDNDQHTQPDMDARHVAFRST